MERTAKSILSEIANRHRNSDLRMDHPDVSRLIDGLLNEIADLKRNLETITEANNRMRSRQSIEARLSRLESMVLLQ